ncbi:MAG TPA: AMP-binding protein [Acidimicrobiales bacterium]|nr:AMP-binding protein [Acidimicrobiales bacterium]
MQRLSSAESEDQQRRVAGALAAAGVAWGARAALLLPRRVEAISAILGALRSGVIPVVLHSGLLPHERDALLADAEVSAVFEGDAGLDALLQGAPRELAPAPLGRPMQYTSGTTGRPKGVWTGVLPEADALSLLREEQEAWGFAADDVHLVCSPLHHSAPIRFSGGTLLAGGDVVLLDRFDVESFTAAVTTHRPTTSFVVPAHLQRVLPSVPDLSSFRMVAHAGAPCAEPLKLAAIDAFPRRALWEFYGSTEGQFTVCSTDEWLERPGTVGRARPGRALATDDDGTIWCSVPSWGRFEYWRDPERTAAAWRGDAFSVGDLGRLDDDGYLFLDGRRDDIIISGGVNVYPLEVEHAVARYAGVEDCAVYPVDDERWGQRVCAAVVGDVDVDALATWLRGQLASHKLPKEVRLVEEIPRSATGKVQRSTLSGIIGR